MVNRTEMYLQKLGRLKNQQIDGVHRMIWTAYQDHVLGQ